jgi:hypothetical protein
MGAAVAIRRLDMTASALRAAASREKDGAAARRISTVFRGCASEPYRAANLVVSSKTAFLLQSFRTTSRTRMSSDKFHYRS